jgi:hypothetical protein
MSGIVIVARGGSTLNSLHRFCHRQNGYPRHWCCRTGRVVTAVSLHSGVAAPGWREPQLHGTRN